MNLDLEDKELIDIEGITYSIPKIFREIDYYINVAKLKTHVETKVGLCMKNQMGILPAEDKIRLHQTDLNKGIALLTKILRPNLCIIEGIVSMEGEGPHHGRPKKTNLLIFSNDIIEIDIVGAYIMGYSPFEVPHIKIAIDEVYGKTYTLSDLEKFKAYKLKFNLPKKYVKKFGVYIWPTQACSRCIFSLARVRDFLSLRPDLLIKLFLASRKQKIHIIIGKGKISLEKDTLKIFIGNCTEAIAKTQGCEFLPGCPPLSRAMFEYIKNKILENKKRSKDV